MEQGEILIKRAKEEGASLVSFGYVGDVVPPRYGEMTHAVSFAVHLSDRIIDDITNGPTHMYFHHYRTVNRVIDDIEFKIGHEIEKKGYRYFPVAASQSLNLSDSYYEGFFSHKMAATRSGLGWVGKNGLLITPEFGPRVRLGTVLTDWPLPVSEPVTTSGCFSCDLCVKACPAVALSGKSWGVGMPRCEIVDAKACSDHMSKYYKYIGRGSVCGICIAACPKGRIDKK
ncbi:MAG: epoxyqueuosine reductase [Peptostreptococcaceae bacterium]|nr:epoxyqueuosine reductase [Peptostreptococcaceae bacterium]